MSAPAASDIAEEFHIRSPVESVLTVSIFVLAYGTVQLPLTPKSRSFTDILEYLAFGPLLFAPLSEIYGRAHLLQSTNLLFLGGYSIHDEERRLNPIQPSIWDAALLRTNHSSSYSVLWLAWEEVHLLP
jgi:hypothetical protein